MDRGQASGDLLGGWACRLEARRLVTKLPLLVNLSGCIAPAEPGPLSTSVGDLPKRADLELC